MALQFLDNRLVGAYIIDVWQNYLNTEMDPADGQWYTNGPGNNGGLYGKLTDKLATELIFKPNTRLLTPHQQNAYTQLIDNRKGASLKNTVTLSHQYTDTTSTTHSTTNALKVGVATDIKVTGDFIVEKTEVTTKFSTEYSYSWTESKTTTSSTTKTFSQTLNVDVPVGKVYQIVLLSNTNQLSIDYEADIYIEGTTSACFKNPVNGQKIHTIDAGTLCSLINQYGSAGDESYKYKRDPKQPSRGAIALSGKMTATQTINFVVQTFDITDSYKGEAIDTSSGQASLVGEQPLK